MHTLQCGSSTGIPAAWNIWRQHRLPRSATLLPSVSRAAYESRHRNIFETRLRKTLHICTSSQVQLIGARRPSQVSTDGGSCNDSPRKPGLNFRELNGPSSTFIFQVTRSSLMDPQSMQNILVYLVFHSPMHFLPYYEFLTPRPRQALAIVSHPIIRVHNCGLMQAFIRSQFWWVLGLFTSSKATRGCSRNHRVS